MGCYQAPDGSLGECFTVADLRRSLLDGTNTADPAQIVSSVRVAQWVMAQPVRSDTELLTVWEQYQRRWQDGSRQ